MTPQQLARIVLKASKIHEKSWKSMDTEDAVRKAVQEEEGVDELFWYPISLAIYWSNDLLEWAERVLKGMKNTSEMFSDTED